MAQEYVKARGLDDVAARFGLGFVGSAIPGHERYRDHLALPYLRPAGGEDSVATVRFRCIRNECVKDSDGRYFFETGQKEQHEHKGGKYNSLPGDPPRMYNTKALIRPSRLLVVVEGEFDAMSWEAAGIPAVGAPGTGTWRDYWTPAFLGYETVYLISEDAAGFTFMESLAAEMPNAKLVEMAGNLDSNSTHLLEGSKGLLERIGL
ncbi:topoisomerase [Streptomyces sp. NPDC057363]|uniref:toprim domain-containing protein n=1 Tax=Streptomyces sp. NPDC057363 TaxID=3346107 RepID=UPI003642A080